MNKKRKPLNLKNYLIPRLRRVWLTWPERTTVVNRCKVYIHEGTYKNGKERMRVYKKCENCGKLCADGDYQVNHIIPVIDPAVGFVDWNTYIERLLCSSDNLNLLCTECHDEETKRQRATKK